MKKIIDILGVICLGVVFGFLMAWGLLGSQVLSMFH